MKLLEQTLDRITPPSEAWREKARQYILTLTMPPWALGRLLDLAVDLAGIQETLKPETVVSLYECKGKIQSHQDHCEQERNRQIVDDKQHNCKNTVRSMIPFRPACFHDELVKIGNRGVVKMVL